VKKKVIICFPTLARPHPAFFDSLERECPLLDAAGFEHYLAAEVGSAYISHARANLLRRALDKQPDMVVFLDDDVSWEPGALVKLCKANGDVVAGTYRYKNPEEEYMGQLITDDAGRPKVGKDGMLLARKVPAGFLKLTINAVDVLWKAYPELIWGPVWYPRLDLFNHGAHRTLFAKSTSLGMWWGEDFAFSQRWLDTGNDLYILPDIDVHHNVRATDKNESMSFKGNYHEFLLRQPGGSKDPARLKEAA
jgi:glycosyltransferase involved in cell wall biosynthesis